MKNFTPTPNNTSTVSINGNWLIYHTPQGNFYSKMTEAQWEIYLWGTTEKQQLRIDLMSQAIDETTFKRNNPTQSSGYGINSGGYILD